MTCVESLENILHQIGLQGRTVLLWSVVPTTMADCVKYRPNIPIHIFTADGLSFPGLLIPGLLFLDFCLPPSGKGLLFPRLLFPGLLFPSGLSFPVGLLFPVL